MAEPIRTEEAGARLSSTSRVEAFSDGVMAIAITLLVLDLKVPDVATTPDGGLVTALLNQWPTYGAYLAAFLTVAVIWVNHHALLEVIARFDRRLQWLNLTLLLGVATLPFPTSLMAQYLREGGQNATVAAAVYGLLALVMALPWTFIWRHLRARPELMEPGYGPEYADNALRRNFLGPLVYAVAAAVAIVAPVVSLALYIAIALFFAGVRQGPRTR